MRSALLLLALFMSACTQSSPPLAAPAKQPLVAVSGVRLLYSGPITRESTEIVRKHLAAHQLRELSISSEGGDVEAALEIATLIQQERLDVEVRGGCLSSCANYIFPSGVQKRIAPGGIVAWHGSPSHLHFLDLTGSGSSDPTIRRHNEVLAKREAEFLRTSGVDPFISWFGKIPPYNAANFYMLSVADMGMFGIRNIAAPEAYGPGYLASLPESFRRDVVFLAIDAGQVQAIRPSWLR